MMTLNGVSTKISAHGSTEPGDDLIAILISFGHSDGIQVFAKEGRLTDAAILFNVDDDFEEDVEPVRNLFSRFYHKGELIGSTLDRLRTIPEIDALNIDGEEVSRN